MRIISVNVGKVVDAAWAGKTGRTAIDKSPVLDRVEARPGGLAGDGRGDLVNHAGEGHAVYAYAREDYDWWEGELRRPLRDGRFGENLTTEGLDVNGAMLGERWRIGSVVLEISGPRVPCVVFRNWMDEPGWVRRFTEAGRPGAYLKVVETGELGAGDGVRIVRRPSDGVTVAEAFRAFHGDKELLRRVLAVPERAAFWDDVATRVLGGSPS
ncbi:MULTISPECIES: MOSC domain-containing protein [unclassified Nonomuraea]|uniref:MOSC domain-containing protein n=1 Tax=unclassified Nonomuraea TaxID=2593643 RepID=UPI0033FC2444